MKEQDYINISDLQRVTVIKNVLNDITSVNSSVIDDNEYEQVIKIVHNWQMKLFKEIKIK